MNARDALGRLLRAACTPDGMYSDARAVVEVAEELSKNQYEMVSLLAVLSRLSLVYVWRTSGVAPGRLRSVEDLLAREEAVERILSHLFDQHEAGPSQG